MFPQARQRGPLGRREIGAEALGEDQGVALIDLAEDESDLLAEIVFGQAFAGGGVGIGNQGQGDLPLQEAKCSR